MTTMYLAKNKLMDIHFNPVSGRLMKAILDGYSHRIFVMGYFLQWNELKAREQELILQTTFGLSAANIRLKY